MTGSGAAALPLDDARVFAEVARDRSFAAAARRLRLPASTVSRAVARLEDALGARLLHRTSRRVSLTDEGRLLLDRAAPLLDELAHVLGDTADRGDAPAGRLRVTCPTVIGGERIAPALIGFAAAHPRVHVDLHVGNALVDLVNEGFDLAFRAGPVTDPDLVARRIWRVDYALAASPDFVARELSGKTTITPEELARLPAIGGQGPREWRFVLPVGPVTTVRPRVVFEASDPGIGVMAARAGLGVVRTLAHLARREGAGLVTLEVTCGELDGRHLFAVYPSRRYLPERVKLAIAWVERALRDDPT
ncbi:MAG: LysR family transcriptional regulator [Deltaproteobacteria bacterium]|nr:LysR family transcriptional regulator [Deltaproteobacteria bacterium]